MSDRHDIPHLPAPLSVERSADELRVALPDGPPASFRHLRMGTLTRRSLPQLLEVAADGSTQRVFVSYVRSSADARAALRDAGVSYAGDDGRVFIRAPGIYVDRDELAHPTSAGRWQLAAEEEESVRNPFAKRSSRVARWLLLHHDEPWSAGAVATATHLNPATVSRLVRTLGDAAFVREDDPAARGRRRDLRVERPRALLEAWLPWWQRRRVRQLVWDIGASDADEALDLLADVRMGNIEGWAVGGLAGAAALRRVVEPSEVLVWAAADVVDALADALQPEPGRTRRGLVRVAVAPDPWTLRLADPTYRFPVADLVQLWLDCASEGERALEAADAVAEVAGWS
jgi:hypothetical protein